MTLKLQIFLLFLIKTLRYLYRLFFFVFCFLTIPCALAFSKITLQLGSCSCIKAAFFGGVDGYRSILPRAISPTSHERCALSIKILFSFVSKSLTFIPIPRKKGKLIKFKPKIKLNHNVIYFVFSAIIKKSAIR